MLCFSLLCVLACPMLPVSLEYPFVIVPSGSSNVYLATLYIYSPSANSRLRYFSTLDNNICKSYC